MNILQTEEELSGATELDQQKFSNALSWGDKSPQKDFLGTNPPTSSSYLPCHSFHGCHHLAGDIVLGVNLCRSLETPNLQGLHCDVTAEMLQQLQHEGVELWL